MKSKASGWMKKWKRGVAALSVAATLGGASLPAHAYEGDPWFHFWLDSVYVGFATSVTNQFFAINTYLANMYVYMISGEGDTGSGIIGAITKHMDLLWSQQRQFQEEMVNKGAAFNRKTALDKATANAVVNRIGDPRVCSELPQRAAGRFAALGGGGGVRGRARTEAIAAQAAPGVKSSDGEHAADMYAVHGGGSTELGIKQGDLCSKQDVARSGDAAKTFGAKRNGYGCQQEGSMPDADARIQSIFVPAHKYEAVANGDPEEIAKASSLTYSQPQAAVASLAAKNAVNAFSTPALPNDIENSPGGKILLAKQKVLQDRMSAGIQALSSLVGSRTPMSAGLGSTTAKTIANNWKQTAADVYQRVFPEGTPVPDVPSMAEMLRYEVYRRFLDVGGQESWINKLDTADDRKVNQMQAETQAVQLYVEWELLNAVRENNAIQAAILAQMVNPVTKQEITAAAASAYRNK